MMIAGDVSGDHHAAPAIKQIVSNFPGAQLWGIGGPRMQAEGFVPLMPFEPFNKMGFIEVIKHLPFFLSAKKRLIGEMALRKPDCLICVDYPGFNMPMMKAAHKLGIPVIWYIAPMVWAWKKKRAAVLAKFTSHIACIFPFEVQYFLPFTSKVSFVGNPLVEAMEREPLEKKAADQPLQMAIVPGSRWQEAEKMLIPMVETYKLLKSKYPQMQGVVSHCGNLPIQFYQNAVSGTDLQIEQKPLRALLSKSDIALVTSGTASLEAALVGVPHVVAYKTSLVNYTIFKNVLNIPYISLPNIISGEKIIPECLQNDMNAEEMSKQIIAMLADHDVYNGIKTKLIGLKDVLGSQKPSLQICQILKDVIHQSKDK